MKKKILGILKESLEVEKADYAEYLMLRDILLNFDGKQITKRVEKSLPDGYTYVIGFSCAEIHSPNGNRHGICYKESMSNFNIEMFDKTDIVYSRGSKERVEKLEKVLENPTEIIESFVAAEKAWKKFVETVKHIDKIQNSFSNPAYYEIIKFIGLTPALMSDVKYNTLK